MFPLACLLIGGIRKDLLDTKFGILTKLFGPAMLFFSPFEIFGAADLIGADEIGLHAMNKNWPVIEALAQTLLQKGRLTEAEALATIGGVHGTTLNS